MKITYKAKQKDTGLARSIRARPVYSRAHLAVAAFADRDSRSQRVRLQIGALQKNCADMFHLVKRAIDVARLKFNPVAAVDDDVGVQSELARVKRAVLDAVVELWNRQVTR